MTIKRFIAWLRACADALERRHQGWCTHDDLRYVADAWDYAYVCRGCGRQWFNEAPVFDSGPPLVERVVF